MINKKPISPENALARAAALCSRCEQAPSDIRNKLASWGITSHDAEIIIQRLTDERFLDERRFAEAYTRDKFHFAGWGRIKIAYQLRTKHIPNDIIEDSLSLIDENEYIDSLKHILNTKMRSLTSKEPLQAKAALLRFASSRGYEPALIYKCLPTLNDCNDDYY